jgi:hypothetical protein
VGFNHNEIYAGGETDKTNKSKLKKPFCLIINAQSYNSLYLKQFLSLHAHKTPGNVAYQWIYEDYFT